MAVDDTELTTATSSTQQDAAADQVTESGAESSAASEGEKFDLLSVVRNAVDDKDGDAAPPAGQSENSDQPKADAAPAKEAKTPDDENFSDAPFHNHPRFKQVIAQRNHYREGAQQYEQVQQFLQDNGISAEEAAEMLTLKALMKTDPQKAWAQFKPIVQQLLVDAGEILPDDLKQRVARGEMSREAAIEYQRLRAAQTSGQKAQQAAAERTQQSQALQAQKAVTDSVAMWEQATRLRDPDFEAKTEALQKEILWLQRRDGLPKTPDAARKMVEEAYQTVSKTARPAARQQMRPVTGGRVTTGQSTAAPTSMLDVVRSVRSG
jgi:hypothetical protein